MRRFDELKKRYEQLKQHKPTSAEEIPHAQKPPTRQSRLSILWPWRKGKRSRLPEDVELSERDPRRLSRAHILRVLSNLALYVGSMAAAYGLGVHHETKPVIALSVEDLKDTSKWIKYFGKEYPCFQRILVHNIGEEEAQLVEFDIFRAADIKYHENSYILQNQVKFDGRRVRVYDIPRSTPVSAIVVGAMSDRGVEIKPIRVKPSGTFRSQQTYDYSVLIIVVVVCVAIVLHIVVLWRKGPKGQN